MAKNNKMVVVVSVTQSTSRRELSRRPLDLHMLLDFYKTFC